MLQLVGKTFIAIQPTIKVRIYSFVANMISHMNGDGALPTS
jgi:hypothetical protein